MKAALPLNENERLRVLAIYKVLDTESEKCFDDLTTLASTICDTPMSAITLIDDDRQWFKSRVGIDVTETSRDVAFCAHTILQDDILQVRDAREDKRFSDNPYVTDESGIRFYAGAPLKIAGDYSLGSLCVMDNKPRELTEKQLKALSILRDAVVTQLNMRKAFDDLSSIEHLLPMCAWCRNIRGNQGDWQPLQDYVNETSQFTHSICPSCTPLMLGQLKQSQKPKQG